MDMKEVETLSEYSTFAKSTDLFGGRMTLSDPAFVSKVLGLVGEAGETADKVKKVIRDKGGIATDEDIAEIKKELGDVLWYVTVMSEYLGSSLAEVAKANVKKLSDRKSRKVISGKGDNR